MTRLLAAILLLLTLDGHAADLPAYNVRAFGPDVGTLIKMNNHRDMIGFTRSGDSYRYFLLSGNVKTYLPENFSPMAINDGKVVAGSTVIEVPEQSTWHSRPAVIHDGQVTTLDIPTTRGFATAINTRGDLAGFYYADSWEESRAFSYVNGQLHPLPGFEPGEPSKATAINDAGIVAGEAGVTFYPHGYPVAWTSQGIRSLTGNSGTVTAINERGTIVGFEVGTTSIFNTTSFMTLPDGTTQSWSAPGEDALMIGDVNNADVAIGTYSALNSSVSRGVLFIGRKRMWLDDLLVAGSGWQITQTAAINDSGEILATGCRAGVCSSVMLMPVPEPGQAMLMGAGLLILAGLGRRRASRLHQT